MAKLYIAERSGTAGGGAGNAQVAHGRVIKTQVLDFSSAHQESVAFTDNTRIVTLHSDAICSFRFGGSVATTSDERRPADFVESFDVQAGDIVSVISNT